LSLEVGAQRGDARQRALVFLRAKLPEVEPPYIPTTDDERSLFVRFVQVRCSVPIISRLHQFQKCEYLVECFVALGGDT